MRGGWGGPSVGAGGAASQGSAAVAGGRGAAGARSPWRGAPAVPARREGPWGAGRHRGCPGGGDAGAGARRGRSEGGGVRAVGGGAPPVRSGRGPIRARRSRSRAARPLIRGRRRGRWGRERAVRPLTRGRTRPGRARRRAARPALGTGRLRAALRFRCGREADGPGGPGRWWLPGGALRGPGVRARAWPGVSAPVRGAGTTGPRRGAAPSAGPPEAGSAALRPVPHRARRRGEPVVQGVPGRCGARVVGGVVVQLPPPVVLVTGGLSPLLAHAPNCPPHGPDENGACGKSGGRATRRTACRVSRTERASETRDLLLCRPGRDRCHRSGASRRAG